MALEGVNFKNTFAQQALCAPSRNSMLTGRRPDSLRLYDFYSYWRDTVGNFTTLPQFFKENGYDTYSVGKVFHPGRSSNFTDDYPYSWSQKVYHPPSESYKDAAVCPDHYTKKRQKNLICPVNVKHQPGKTLPDIQTLEYAVNIIKNRSSSSKPYLLAVGFYKPHIPLKFPKEYLERVPMDIIRPPIYPDWPKDIPIVAWHPWMDLRRRDDIRRLNITFPLGKMPEKWAMKIKRSYFAASMYVDDLIGVLMKQVDTRNTVVVLTSDHGWSLGENSLWAKYSNFDAALRVPLIFNIPGYPAKDIDTPVELVDIFPTLLDVVGFSHNINPCKGTNDKSILCFEGKSLKPLMNDNNDVIEDELYSTSQYPRPSGNPAENSDEPKLKDINIMGYSVRTKQYRFTQWISFNNTVFTRNWTHSYGCELYDHVIDNYETINVCYNYRYKYIQRYLLTLLKSKVETII